MNTMICPVCSGGEWRVIREIYDDRYGCPRLCQLVECEACRHVATFPRLGDADLPLLYGTYYPRRAVVSSEVLKRASGAASLRRRISRWMAGTDNQGQYEARSGERMLDIGCGDGSSLLEAAEFGASAWGVEADPNVERIARELNLTIHVGTLSKAIFADQKFDLVVMNQVIEHVPEPQEMLKRIRLMLSPGGRAILVFPNRRSAWCRFSGDSWINWHVPYHLHHFDFDGFSRMAARSGFKVVKSRTITPNLWVLLQIRSFGRRVALGQASPVWGTGRSASGGDSEARRVPTVFVAVRRALIGVVLLAIGVVCRMIDGIGQGDSLMVEIQPYTER